MTDLPNNVDSTRLEVYELADAVLSGTISAEQKLAAMARLHGSTKIPSCSFPRLMASLRILGSSRPD